jgi:hypothetical protein
VPTFATPSDPGQAPVERIGHSPKWSLWRWFTDNTEGFIPVARTVLIVSGVAVPLATEGPRTFTQDDLDTADSGSGDNGQAIFRAGTDYTITAGEDTILTAGGYTTT